ncbi:hypothetical protein MUN88_13460 [Gracilibacillus caseinilyticus]|uniref:Prolipoprotein diacylglyceryl transferase n=1 Tax=Gracilibacillus caseinilyticus TaxID=2932256 RepID=A0ABY4ETJ6_9BACI|nr:hypothetical protein [Gracilibacillus caseinilyticus]UOQ47087.1 hypothetical protein MUN88_13460 [Gracilibacillus caseinilyticus]
MYRHSMEIAGQSLYQQSDVVAAWAFSIIGFACILYYLTKKRKWGTIWSYVTTTNHRKIGMMYLLSGVIFFLRGGIDALLIRTQLIAPDMNFWVFQGDK